MALARNNYQLKHANPPEPTNKSIPNLPKMSTAIKISSLNLCLRLQAKKNIVKQTVLHEEIDIMCMQETEINFNLDHKLLSFPGFSIETENNSQISRVAFYINNRIRVH